MAESYKRLGAVAPVDDREQLLYVAPAATQTLVSNITVTNRSSSSTSFDINVYESGVTQQSALNDYQATYFAAGSLYYETGYYSTNGITWTANTFPFTHAVVGYGNEKFIAVRDQIGTSLATSEDGINWTQSSLPLSGQFRKVLFANAKFLLLNGTSEQTLFSTDGASWTSTTLPQGPPFNIEYGNGVYISYAYYSSQIYASTDAITWTSGTAPYPMRSRLTAYGNGIFLIAGVPWNNTQNATYSTDGITWTQTTMPQSIRWNALTYGDGKFVALAYGSSIVAISTDAITWTNATLPLSRRWNQVKYGDGKFVALTQQYFDTAYSTDAITWTQSSAPVSNTPTDLAFADPMKKYQSPRLNNIYKNFSISANDTKVLEPGIALGSQSSIIVKDNSGGNLTFFTYGVELS